MTKLIITIDAENNNVSYSNENQSGLIFTCTMQEAGFSHCEDNDDISDYLEERYGSEYDLEIVFA